jgi:tetratricopeptide (TPR) repeat protein
LECSKSNQFVHRAIDSSFKILTDEQKKDFVRLAVFEESFSEEAAKVVIEKDNLDTKRILETLFSRSLIKQPTMQRYSIHLLIKHFLRDQLKGKNKRAKKARAEASRAKVLMVEYYLNLGHDLTINSYSKDGYKANREALKQEAHNIQNVLKICCEQEDPESSDISHCLAHSEVYITSAKFFSLFVRTIIPGSIVDEFLQRCANLAEERKQHAIKINFDCLVADQERSKSISKSDECFNSKMEEIKTEFDTHYEDLKEDKSLCAHYYYQYGRYISRKSESERKNSKPRLDLQVDARKELEKSLELRKTLIDTSVGIADTVFSLSHLGNICKVISATEYHLHKTNDSKKSLKQAEEYYEKARKLSQNHLGEHELTASCYKRLGDLFLSGKKPEQAEDNYTIAKEMRENLELYASERHVYLLNNLGICLTRSNRVKEATEVLESARDMAEKLAESDEPNVCKTKVYTSLAIAHHSILWYSKDAVKYAKKALELDKLQNFIKDYEYKELLKISQGNVGNN